MEENIFLRNNIGTYSSIDEVWDKYPNGGLQGDYAMVALETLYWSVARGNWLKYIETHQDRFGYDKNGDYIFRDNVTVCGTLRAYKINPAEKGLFGSLEALKETYPEGNEGDWALVGTSSPFPIYKWSEHDQEWFATGGTTELSVPVEDVEEAKRAGVQFGLSSIRGEGDISSYVITYCKGYYGEVKLPMPVHGGDDGVTPAKTPALIGVDTFRSLSGIIANIETILSSVEMLPLHIGSIEAVDPSLISDGEAVASEMGGIIYDENSRTFLYKKLTSIFSGDVVYYRRLKDNKDVGHGVTAGRVYVCGSRMFVGMPDLNLNEILRNQITEIQDL